MGEPCLNCTKPEKKKKEKGEEEVKKKKRNLNTQNDRQVKRNTKFRQTDKETERQTELRTLTFFSFFLPFYFLPPNKKYSESE